MPHAPFGVIAVGLAVVISVAVGPMAAATVPTTAVAGTEVAAGIPVLGAPELPGPVVEDGTVNEHATITMEISALLAIICTSFFFIYPAYH